MHSAVLAVHFFLGIHINNRSLHKWVLFYLGDMQGVAVNAETDFQTRKTKTIYAGRVVLISGAGVLCKQCFEGGLLICGDFCQQFGGKVNFQGISCFFSRKSASCIGLAVGKGEIGFYIKDRRTVHQIGTAYTQYSAVIGGLFNAQKFNTGKPDGIGAERRPSGKNSHTLIAAQSWGTDCG